MRQGHARHGHGHTRARVRVKLCVFSGYVNEHERVNRQAEGGYSNSVLSPRARYREVRCEDIRCDSDGSPLRAHA